MGKLQKKSLYIYFNYNQILQNCLLLYYSRYATTDILLINEWASEGFGRQVPQTLGFPTTTLSPKDLFDILGDST